MTNAMRPVACLFPVNRFDLQRQKAFRVWHLKSPHRFQIAINQKHATSEVCMLNYTLSRFLIRHICTWLWFVRARQMVANECNWRWGICAKCITHDTGDAMEFFGTAIMACILLCTNCVFVSQRMSCEVRFSHGSQHHS